MNRIFAIYKRLLEIHILTKTTDQNGFHSDTATAYEKAFDVFHTVSELKQDLEIDAPELVKDVADEALTLMEELKGLTSDMVNKNKDIAMDELLRGLTLSIAGICGDLRKHLCDEE